MAPTPSLRLFLLLVFLLKVTPSKGISYEEDVYSALEKQYNSFNKRLEDLEFTVKKQEKVTAAKNHGVGKDCPILS